AICEPFEHLHHQRIGLFDRGFRLIDEARLNGVPARAESTPFLVMEERDWLFRLDRTSIHVLGRARFPVRDRPSFTFYRNTFVHDALPNAPSSVLRRSSKSAR